MYYGSTYDHVRSQVYVATRRLRIWPLLHLLISPFPACINSLPCCSLLSHTTVSILVFIHQSRFYCKSLCFLFPHLFVQNPDHKFCTIPFITLWLLCYNRNSPVFPVSILLKRPYTTVRASSKTESRKWGNC